jgi:hypothetical protein
MFRVEVQADASNTWATNKLTFETREEAEAYGHDLASRWTAVIKWRVLRIEDEVEVVLYAY